MASSLPTRNWFRGSLALQEIRAFPGMGKSGGFQKKPQFLCRDTHYYALKGSDFSIIGVLGLPGLPASGSTLLKDPLRKPPNFRPKWNLNRTLTHHFTMQEAINLAKYICVNPHLMEENTETQRG